VRCKLLQIGAVGSGGQRASNQAAGRAIGAAIDQRRGEGAKHVAIGWEAEHGARQRFEAMLGEADSAPGSSISRILRQRPAEVAARLVGWRRDSGEVPNQVMFEMSTGPWRKTIHFLVSGRNSMP
jgi:hypothetical protein